MSPGYKKYKKQVVRHGLGDVARRELGVELDKDCQKADWGGDLTEEMLKYAAKDSQVLLPLVEALGAKVHRDRLDKVLELERRVTPAMTWMAAAGVPIDEEGWRGYRRQNEAEVKRVLEKLEELAPTDQKAAHGTGIPGNRSSRRSGCSTWNSRIRQSRPSPRSPIPSPLHYSLTVMQKSG